MKKLIVYLFIGFAIIHQGCTDCHLVDCIPAGDNLIVKLEKDGENWFSMPDTIIENDPIEIIRITENLDTTYFDLVLDSLDNIELFIEEGRSYHINIGSLDSFVIAGRSIVDEKFECCNSYQLVNVFVDSEMVCTFACDTITLSID